MIKQGDVIKHNAFMDVAVQIISSSTHPETGDIEIRGIWINQGQVETFYTNEPAHFTIKQKHIGNWLKCNNSKAKFIRNQEWTKLL